MFAADWLKVGQRSVLPNHFLSKQNSTGMFLFGEDIDPFFVILRRAGIL